MECAKCKNKYKSQKTLEQHLKRIYKVEEVIPEVIPEVVEDVAPEVNPEVNPKEEQNHNCDTCIKCKDELEYYKKLSDTLYKRYIMLKEQVNILMEDFLRNKYIKEHNEQNPDNKITEKEFNEMYKVIYPYVIPKEWHTDIINGFDEIIKEIYKDKNIKGKDLKALIKYVKDNLD